MSTSVEWDGRLAAGYDRGRALNADAIDAWHATVAPFVRAGHTVADVGAGTGRFSALFADRFGVDVIAVEPSAAMRARATSHSRVSWAAGAAEDLPLKSNSIDVAWLCCVVHYLDLNAAGRELRRVVREGGHVLSRSVFPDRFDELEWLRWFPSARRIDEERMPSVDTVADAWTAAGLVLRDRVLSQHLAATSLNDLADRLAHRSISTLELISDDEFDEGLAALRHDAAEAAEATDGDGGDRPIYSPVDVLVFQA